MVASESDYDSVHSRVPFHQGCTVVIILGLLGASRSSIRPSRLNRSGLDCQIHHTLADESGPSYRYGCPACWCSEQFRHIWETLPQAGFTFLTSR